MVRFFHLECHQFHFPIWTNLKLPLFFHWGGTLWRHRVGHFQSWLASGSRDWITSNQTIQRQNNTFILGFTILLLPSVVILKKKLRQLIICLLYLWVQEKVPGQQNAFLKKIVLFYYTLCFSKHFNNSIFGLVFQV